MSLLLAKQIIHLLLILLAGLIAVRAGVFKVEESRVISLLIIYVIAPCAIIHSFSVRYTPEILSGLIISFILAVICNVIFIGVAKLLAKPLRFDTIEQTSVVYSNAGNLILPLVASVLGEQWIIYTSGYLIVQTVLLWTHCISVITERHQFTVRSLFNNVGVLSILIGMAIFGLQIPLPNVLNSTLSTIGSMMGPLSMFVIGMLIGNIDLKTVVLKARNYLIVFMRLIILPLIILVIYKVSHVSDIVSIDDNIFVVVLLAASAPIGTSVAQFAQIGNKNASYASQLNVLSVLLSVVTMPMIMIINELL